MRRQKYKYFFDIKYEAPAVYFTDISGMITRGDGRANMTVEVARTTRPMINDGVLTIITMHDGVIYMPWARVITIRERAELQPDALDAGGIAKSSAGATI